jgi:hypothetical protein
MASSAPATTTATASRATATTTVEASTSSAAAPTQFFVQYCPSWDGGDQERRAATQFILEAFPKAKVTAAYHRVYPNTVVVNVGTDKQHSHLVTVSQRDLYSKYGHPAKSAIMKALKRLA